VGGEVVGVRRHASPLQIRRAGHDDSPVLDELEPYEARIAERADAHSDVDVLVNNVGEPVGQIQRDRDVAMRGEESRHQWRHMYSPESGRSGHA
jgi:hypothetical protein